MTSNPDKPAEKELPLARYALIAAALIALVTIGFAVVNRGPKPVAPHAETATADAPAGDIASAIGSLEARLKANPKDVEGWRLLGRAFYENQKFAESAQAYARATQLAPDVAESWSALGEARILAGPEGSPVFPPDALTAFQKAVALDPMDPRARYFIGVAKDMGGDHKGAIDQWFALLKDSPADAPWLAQVREVIINAGAKHKIEVADRLAKTSPAPTSGGAVIASAAIPGPDRAQMQAASQLPKGQQDMMIQGMVDGLEKKLKANPDNPQGWIMLMRSRMQLGETVKANQAYRDGKAAFTNDTLKRGQLDAAAATLGIKG
jgi:cytochrome c-type biogenesis protein CcmH